MQKNLETTLYIMRHGETEMNVKGIWQGHSDSPLTDNGIEKLKKVAEELRGVKFDAIYSSDLLRTKRTAEIIKMERELDIRASELLRERNFGYFETKHREEMKKLEEFKKLFDEFDALAGKERYKFNYNGIFESYEELEGRFKKILKEISLAHLGETVLVVTSGGPFRTLLGEFDPKYYAPINNGGYAIVNCDGEKFKLIETKGIEVPK